MKLLIIMAVFQTMALYSIAEDSRLLYKRVHGVIAQEINRNDIFQEDTILISLLYELPLVYQDVNLNCTEQSTLDCKMMQEFNSLNHGISRLEDQQGRSSDKELRVKREAFRAYGSSINATTTNSRHRDKRQILALLGLGGAGYFGYKMYHHQAQLDQQIHSLRATDEEIIAHVKSLEIAGKNTDKRLAYVEKDLRVFSKAQTETNNAFYKAINGQAKEIVALYRLHLRTLDYFRFRNIAGSCRLGLLPEELVNREDLVRIRRNIIQQLKNHTMTSAVEERDLGSLYAKPLAKCVIGETKMLVKYTYPLVRKKAHIRLFKISTVPFAHHNQICKLDIKTQYISQINNEIYPVSDSNCNIERGVCKISEGTATISEEECTATLLRSDSLEDLKKACSFVCYNKNSNKVIVTKIGPLVYVTNADNITIVCDDKTYEYHNLLKIGSVEILLSQNCVATANNQLVLPRFSGLPRSIFKTGHRIYVTIPGGWSKGLDAISTDNALFKNISEMYDSNWYKHLNVHNLNSSNITDFNPTSWRDLSVNHLVEYASMTDFYSVIVWFWLLVLTILVFVPYYSKIKSKICSCRIRRPRYIRAQNIEMV